MAAALTETFVENKAGALCETHGLGSRLGFEIPEEGLPLRAGLIGPVLREVLNALESEIGRDAIEHPLHALCSAAAPDFDR